MSSNKELTDFDPRWARILARDKAADGLFWYSVATTGIFCRPSCPSGGAIPTAARRTRRMPRSSSERAA